MKNMKKIILTLLISIIVIFALINIIWYTWREIKYSSYRNGMQKNEFYSLIIPRYYENDKDGFTYSVKYPDYLSLTGNLSLGFPPVGDDPYTDAIIIWPKLNGDYEYGLLLYDEDGAYMIEIDKNGKALDSEYDDVIKTHKENIEILFNKAKEKWNLGL